MRRGAISLLAIPLLVFDGWGGKAAPPRAEEVAVRAVVQAYFDGLMQGSREKLRTAFDGDACLTGVGHDGEYMRIPFERWSAAITRSRVNPRAYRNEIARIDITGDAAMVKTVLRWPGVMYVDYLSLLRHGDGDWRIVHRARDATPR